MFDGLINVLLACVFWIFAFMIRHVAAFCMWSTNSECMRGVIICAVYRVVAGVSWLFCRCAIPTGGPSTWPFCGRVVRRRLCFWNRPTTSIRRWPCSCTWPFSSMTCYDSALDPLDTLCVYLIIWYPGKKLFTFLFNLISLCSDFAYPCLKTESEAAVRAERERLFSESDKREALKIESVGTIRSFVYLLVEQLFVNVALSQT